jgi:integrase
MSKPTPGIAERHARGCATDPCTCKPTYQAHVFDARTGKRIRRTFPTKTAAKLWRQDALVALRRGQLSPTAGSPTIATALDELVDGMSAGRILDRSGGRYRPSTVRGYAQIAETYLKPALGSRRLSDLHRRDVQALVEQLRGKGLAASTVVNTLDPLRVICRRAIRDGLTAIDPTKGLELPAKRGRRAPVVDIHRAERLLDALALLERATYGVFLYAGLRRGEAQALRVSDVNLDSGVIHVRHGWDQAGGEQDVKTEAGHRSVPIPEALRVILADWLLRSDRWGDDLLLGRTASQAFVPSTLRSRAHRAWKQAGLEPLTPHEARHVAASFLLAAGVPLFEVSRYVGHTDIRTTANIYGHLVQGREQEAARRLDKLFSGEATRQLRDSRE